MGGRVLIVEDEPDIRDLLAFHLEREGYHVTRSRTGADALRQVRARPPDLILLDLMLPELGGLDVCRRLRQDPRTASVPIVMLTARGRGGRPHPRARARRRRLHRQAVLSEGGRGARARRAAPGGARDGAAPVVSGRLVIDPERHTVQVDAAAIELTPKEFDLLRALAEARGRVLSREFLLDRVWGYASAGEIESRTVDVHVRRLRMKLGDEGQRITTVKGVGYRLEVE